MVRDKPNYTTEQLKAIEHDTGHLRIIACAGSGKTQIISERLANLIKKGINPKEIVAFTFTVKAAEELKSRIRYILDHDCPDRADFGDMYVGTIDSFCFKMLQEIDPYYKNFDMIEGAKQVAYLSKSHNYYRMKLKELRKYKSVNKQLVKVGDDEKGISQFNTIGRFINSASIMMMEEIDPNSLSNEDFKYSYNKYLELLKEDNYLDFPSVIRLLISKLETSEEARKELNDKVKHLIVDEYQDINSIQEHLIEIISDGADSVCVVGDDDQCIYQWRGSHVENIISFQERYQKKGCNVISIPLNKNFRSAHSVIHTSREFIRRNKNRLTEKEMDFNENLKRTHEKGDIIFHFTKTEPEELEFIHQKIDQLIGTDFLDKKNNPYSLSYGDFAILVKSNTEASKVLEFLREKKIRCLAYSGAAIFQTLEVELVMNCISYVFGCQSMGYGPTATEEILDEQYGLVFSKEQYPDANKDQFFKDLDIIKSQIDRVYQKTPKDYLGDLGLQAVYHKILSALGAQRFDFGEEYHYHFAVLSSAISDYESVWKRLRAAEVKDFFHFAQAFGQNNYTETQYEDASLIDAVKIMTVWKSKGLEFPVVFFPGLSKKRKPAETPVFIDDSLYPTHIYSSDVEDERRVFYTAFTRSEKYLFLSGYEQKEGNKRPYVPHPFIEELDKKFIDSDLKLVRKKSGYEARKLHEATFPTSFSELTTYDRCPYDFWLRNICGYNAGVPAAFGYGTNIHNILNMIHNNYIKTEHIPSDQEIDKLIERAFFLRYATEAISKNMKIAAKRIVKNYVKMQKNEFKKVLETEKRFEFVIDQAIISGQIDLLKKINEDGQVEEVEIIDFKTENDKGAKPYEMDYHKQLRLYALACLKSLGLSPKKAVIHHLDKNLINKKTSVDISEDALSNTKDEISKTIGSILDKKFNSKPSKLCTECDYRYVCSKKEKCVKY